MTTTTTKIERRRNIFKTRVLALYKNTILVSSYPRVVIIFDDSDDDDDDDVVYLETLLLLLLLLLFKLLLLVLLSMDGLFINPFSSCLFFCIVSCTDVSVRRPCLRVGFG